MLSMLLTCGRVHVPDGPDCIQNDAVLWALLDVAGVSHLSYEVGISIVVDGLLLSLKDSISQTSQLLQVCL